MINDVYSVKQLEVLECSVNDEPKILVCSGAKRAGKTFVLIQAFILHMAEFKNKGVSFIIGGATISTVQRNILDDMEKLLGMEIKLNKKGGFELWGNMIYCFGGANSDSWKSVRGFTGAGAFLNEGTALHDMFVKEVISRCSYAGSRIFIDTNPENPLHSVKVDYIDKDGDRLKNGKLNIKVFNFNLYDNTKLDEEYVESIERVTPTGMFYDRDILGNWVAAEGIVYKDFNKEIHLVDKIPKGEHIERYIGGIDFGFEHYGSIVVIAICTSGNYYLVEEVAEQYKYIEWWIDRAKEFQYKYYNLFFYADSARPEYVQQMKEANIYIENANKSVIEGINAVGSLLKQKKLFFIKDKFKKGLEEMFLYCWATNNKGGKEEVLKINDDVMDSLRYGIFSDMREYNNDVDDFIAF